jgi:Zn-dependent M16 (insulinase) family peptidase
MTNERDIRLTGGFRLLERRFMPGIRSNAFRALHDPSGAELVFFRCRGDREKLFAAVFRTPPEDSTGVPHILEHCVLCGSARFPLKDPFMELVKTSMATYINAVTYDDRTVYPCASLITRDFLNLVDVYMDAVFHPLLDRFSFLQEGHRLDFLEDGRTARMGVVYNEMRGAYSDPDDYLERRLRALLFPGTTYGHCSGGEPDRIPGLTYEAFVDFHGRHYHPANCCLLVMADIPEDEVTGFLGERLRGFAPASSSAEIITEPEFVGPSTGEYPVPGSRKSGCTVLRAWLMDRGDDPVESLAVSLLDDVLLEGDAAPLKDALVGSGLGSGLGPSGYDCDIARPTFTAGLRGVERERSGEVFRLMDLTLGRCAERLNPEDTMGFLHRKELLLRRIGQRWAHGILGAAAKAWTHGRNPLDELEEESHLAGLRLRLDRDSRYMEGMIRRYLLDNRGRIDAVFHPDPARFRRQGRRREKAAEREGERLGPEGRESLRLQSLSLKTRQDTPDSPEAAAALPALCISDIPREPSFLDFTHRERAPGVHLITVPGFTNGVCHLNISLGLGLLQPGDFPLAQLAAETVTGTGAGGLSYREASRRETACSGGIAAGVSAYEPLGTPGTAHPVVSFNVSCLEGDLSGLLSLLEARITSPDLDDLDRVAELGREVESGLRARFEESAGGFAGLEAVSELRGGMEVVRLLKGMPMARTTCRLAAGRPSALSGRLRGIWDRLRLEAPVALAWTGPEELLPAVESFLDGLPGTRSPFAPISFPRDVHQGRRGIVTDSEVACVAGAFPGKEPDDPLFEPLLVLMTLLGNGPMWDRIRGRIGAYGVSSWAGPGLLAFSTYRDPSPGESLSTALEILGDPERHLNLDEKAIRGAVFSTLQRVDPLVRPARAPLTATASFFTGMDMEYHRKVWNRLLEVDADSLRRASEFVAKESRGAVVCVAADRENLDGIGVVNAQRL